MKFVNAEEMAAENPDTFFIPSYEERTGIKAGDNIKVCFDYENGEDNERMWIKVTSVEHVNGAPIYTGFLNNDPLSNMVSYKDIFQVEPKNIYSIYAE